MAVTAKFRVTRVTPMGDKAKPYATEVEFTPDYVQGRNADWSSATPSGVIRLTITNEKALEELEEGVAFDVLFTKNPDQP